MGYSLDAYYIIDQNMVKQLLNKYNVDVNDWEDCKILAHYLYKNITGELGEDLNIVYSYNNRSCYDEEDEPVSDDKCKDKRHVLWIYHQCNYIRNHPVLDINNPNRTELPEELQGCIFNIHTPQNAKDVAAAIRAYFPLGENAENSDVLWFAEWLEKTARFCYCYELNT